MDSLYSRSNRLSTHVGTEQNKTPQLTLSLLNLANIPATSLHSRGIFHILKPAFQTRMRD